MFAPYCGEYQKDYVGATALGSPVAVDSYADCAEICSADDACKNWFLTILVSGTTTCTLKGEKAAAETPVSLSVPDTW